MLQKKHIDKFYEKQIKDRKEKSIIRWKSKEECLHVKHALEYDENMQRNVKFVESRGSIEAQFGKIMVGVQLKKIVHLSVVFHIFTRGRPMIDYPEYNNLLSFLGVPNFPSTHWSINYGQEWASCLVEVEKQDLQEK